MLASGGRKWWSRSLSSAALSSPIPFDYFPDFFRPIQCLSPLRVHFIPNGEFSFFLLPHNRLVTARDNESMHGCHPRFIRAALKQIRFDCRKKGTNLTKRKRKGKVNCHNVKLTMIKAYFSFDSPALHSSGRNTRIFNEKYLSVGGNRE